jgi:hypothetical protein
MITNEQLSKFSGDERSAWIDSLNEDESAILHSAIGHRYTFVFISLVKQLLAEEDLPAHYRLKYLEWLDKRNEPWESPQVISAIEPMCAEGYQLLRETMKLGHKKGFDMIGSWQVFNAFVALNPSILTAIKMSPTYQHHPKRAAAPEARP